MMLTSRHRGRHSPRAIAAGYATRIAAADRLIADLSRQLAAARAAEDRANTRANELAEADVRAARLADELQAARAELANLRAVTVPAPADRATDDGETTHPIPISTLWDALGGTP